MIGSLYIIKNLINDKVYIGKTYNNSIEKRLKSHFRDAKRFKNRPLYRAINKYGPDNFYIELLGQYEEGILEEKEIDYISRFNSYKAGYNATLGGDGKRYIEISDKEIIETYRSSANLAETARKLGINYHTVSKVLENYGIARKALAKEVRKQVLIVDINEVFSNTNECVHFLIDSEISTASEYATRKGIEKACSGQRKTYLGLTFRWV